MAAGYRHLTAGYTVTDATDVRTKAAVLEDLIGQLVALNIGWSIYKTEYSNTSYTASTCEYRLFLRYKDSDHLYRFYIRGSNSSSSAYYSFYCNLMAAGLSETVTLMSWSNQLSLYYYNNYPYTMYLGLTVFFGGDDWSWLVFKNYGDYNAPAAFAGTTGYGISACSAVQIDNAAITDSFVYLTASTSYVTNVISIGYQKGEDIAIGLTGNKDNIVANNADFEIIRDVAVNNTKLKLKSCKLFSNSYGASLGTLYTINSEKWVLINNQIYKIYDPAA